MKRIAKKYIGILLGVLAMVPFSCKDDIDSVIEEIDNDRAFAPVGLVGRIRNQVDIELSWTAQGNVSQYLIEFFQDSLEFEGDPIATGTVDEVPEEGGTLTYTETFEGETRYSARVKAIVEGKEESNWANLTISTDPEQIFLAIPLENFQDTYATLLWPAGSTVTNFLVEPGNILIPISDAQKAAGEATIEGLNGGTDYTVTLYNGSKRRGTVSFSTLKEANVTALDDLAAVVASASEGDELVLAEGEYNIGELQITKSLVIEGQKPYDKPVILGRFTFGTTVASFTTKSLDMRSDEGSSSQAFNTYDAAANLGELIIDGCEISDYANNVMYNQSSGTYGDIIIRNSYIHDIAGTGGDGFDFRGGTVGSLTVENTTFSTGIRSFVRMQVPSDVVFRNCTFYRVCSVASSNNRGFFRLSGGGNTLNVSNCLFVETGVDDAGNLRGVWSKAGDISEEVVTTFSNNYYFNVIGLFDGVDAAYTDPTQVDAAEADPQFEDPENGDFSIGNQLLIDEEVGDSQWWN